MSFTTTAETVRARTFDEYIGQDKLKSDLTIQINSAIDRKAPLDHIMLVAPPGYGKTTLAAIIAAEIGDPFIRFKPPYTEKEFFYRMVEFGRGIVFLDEALSVDTPIPTPSGWTTMGSLAPGDQVFGSDGHPCRVISTTPIQDGHPCYKIRLRGKGTTPIVADANHKWLARLHNANTRLREFTTEQLYELKSKGTAVLLPRRAPLDLPSAQLAIDPYVLGVWIGDGSTGQAILNLRSEDAEEIISSVQEQYPEVHQIASTNPNVTKYSMAKGYQQRSPFRIAAETYGIWNDKKIPPIYLRASIQQRVHLLQGLMDTDGSVTNSGYCTIGTTIPSVASAVRELLSSLGYDHTTAVGIDPRKETYKPYHRISFQGDPSHPPARLSRHLVKLKAPVWSMTSIAEIVPIESCPVRCIAVDSPDHLFLAGQEMVPTHNCHNAKRPFQEMLLHALEDGTISIGSDDAYSVAASTFILGTTDPHKVIPALRSRAFFSPRFQEYSDDEMADIMLGMAERMDVTIDPTFLPVLARAAGGVPRAASKFVVACRDIPHAENVDEILRYAGFDEDGLSEQQIEYLETLRTLGDKSGLRNIMSMLQISADQVEELERLPIRRGFIRLTPNGRMLTTAGIKKVLAPTTATNHRELA